MVALMGQQEFVITVKNGETFDGLIAAGRYDWKWNEITEKRFPVRSTPAGERKLVLLHFGRDISSEDAIKEATKQGLERPTYEDCFRFGAQHPEVQRSYPVVFLVESMDVLGYLRILRLSGDIVQGRLLSYFWFDDILDRTCRIAFVQP